jgi:UDP-glucose 4-epimerase
MNVGSGAEVSINELVERIGEVTGRPLHVLRSSSESGGVSRLVADIRLAREKLGFRPRVSLGEGLRRVMAENPQFVR